MEVEKIRNLSDEELALEGRKAAEQLFRLRFQMKLGQTEGVKKLRDLKRDVARVNTIVRERELGIHALVAAKHPAAEPQTHAEEKHEAHEKHAPARHAAAKKKAVKPAKKAAKKAAAAHKPSGRSSAARKSSARPSGNKKQATRSTSVKKG